MRNGSEKKLRSITGSLAVYSFLVLIFFAFSAVADEIIDDAKSKSYSALLAKTEKDLKKGVYDEKALPSVIKQLTPVKSDAVQCVLAEDVQLEKLKLDLASLGEATKGEAKEVRKKRAELKNEINKSEKRLANCRVLILRSEEILKELADYQQSLLAERLLAVGPDIKLLLQENWNKPALWWQSISSFVTKNSGLELLSLGKSAGLLMLMAVAFAIGILFKNKLIVRVRNKTAEATFSNHFTCNLIVVVSRYMPNVLVSFTAAIFFYVMTYGIRPVPFVSVVVYGLPIYFLLRMVVELFLNPEKDAELFDNFPVQDSRALARRLNVLFLLLFIGYLLFTTILALSFPEAVYLLAREIFAVIFVLNLIWAVWIISRIPNFEEMIGIRFGTSLVLVVILIIELLGYRNLTSYIVVGVIGSFLSLGVFLLLSRFTAELFEGLEKGKKRWQKNVRESLGVKKRKKLPELAWVKLIVIAGLWLTLLVVLLRLWGLSETGFAQLRAISLEGFTIGSLKVVPARVLLAVIVLTAMLAINSWFRTRLEQSWLSRTNIERGAREATATISGYIGVALAILISMSVAGVEFGNLAIIAGALSVGIGFGLQNIVNNFVSGLILLFERPIKTGDWIVVGNTEGFVKRISIRSTQIQTFDQADVIVPNSELISGQVTNWMLRDVRGRIRVPVGVAYGSDTKLVHDVLLGVAQENEFVVNDGSSPEPRVLFMDFGDSSLNFELRVFINSIDMKPAVTSELNFAIDAAFREHHIEIPFPQRDLHIKSGKID